MANLKDQVTVQKFTYTSSSQGSDVRAWVTHRVVWADIEEVSGSEGFTSEMDVYSDVKSFKVPYVDGSDVTARMRILYGSDKFYITRIVQDNRLWTTLIAVRNDDE